MWVCCKIKYRHLLNASPQCDSFLVANGYWRRNPHHSFPSLLTSCIAAEKKKIHFTVSALHLLFHSHVSHPPLHLLQAPILASLPTIHPLEFKPPSSLSFYRSSCTAPPLLLPDPLPIPPTMQPSPSALLFSLLHLSLTPLPPIPLRFS